MTPLESGPTASTLYTQAGSRGQICSVDLCYPVRFCYLQLKQQVVQFNKEKCYLSNYGLNLNLPLGWWYTGQLFLSSVAWALSHWEWVTNFYLDSLSRSWALCFTCLPVDANINQSCPATLLKKLPCVQKPMQVIIVAQREKNYAILMCACAVRRVG